MSIRPLRVRRVMRGPRRFELLIALRPQTTFPIKLTSLLSRFCECGILWVYIPYSGPARRLFLLRAGFLIG